MEATLGTLERYSHEQSHKIGDITTAVGNWLSGVFGCAHRDMSRPFSRHGESYRVCIACGAHRRFDAQSWKPRGPYFYRPANTAELLEVDCTALRSL
jgi:hypothetical protein